MSCTNPLLFTAKSQPPEHALGWTYWLPGISCSVLHYSSSYSSSLYFLCSIQPSEYVYINIHGLFVFCTCLSSWWCWVDNHQSCFLALAPIALIFWAKTNLLYVLAWCSTLPSHANSTTAIGFHPCYKWVIQRRMSACSYKSTYYTL